MEKKEINGVAIRPKDIYLVQCLANEMSKQEIEQETGIGVRAVESAIYRLKARMGIKTTAALCVVLHKHGLID